MKINISFRKFVAKSLIWLRNSAQNTISTSDIHYIRLWSDDMPLLSQWINKKGTSGRQKFLFCCERAVKRCVNIGKNSEKYTGKLLDKLELVEMF